MRVPCDEIIDLARPSERIRQEDGTTLFLYRCYLCHTVHEITSVACENPTPDKGFLLCDGMKPLYPERRVQVRPLGETLSSITHRLLLDGHEPFNIVAHRMGASDNERVRYLAKLRTYMLQAGYSMDEVAAFDRLPCAPLADPLALPRARGTGADSTTP